MHRNLEHRVPSKHRISLQILQSNLLSLRRICQRIVRRISSDPPPPALTKSAGLFINVVRPANVSYQKPLPVLFVRE